MERVYRCGTVLATPIRRGKSSRVDTRAENAQMAAQLYSVAVQAVLALQVARTVSVSLICY